VDIPNAMLVSGNTLYVENNSGNSVTAYNATSGGSPTLTISSGLSDPNAMLLSDGTLYVSSYTAGTERTGTVTAYDATTGGAPTMTISTGMNGPEGLALQDNTLYVSNNSIDTVTAYDATTGGSPTFTISGISEPEALAVSSVPEPGSWMLLAGGLGLLGGARPRRVRADQGADRGSQQF